MTDVVAVRAFGPWAYDWFAAAWKAQPDFQTYPVFGSDTGRLQTVIIRQG